MFTYQELFIRHDSAIHDFQIRIFIARGGKMKQLMFISIAAVMGIFFACSHPSEVVPAATPYMNMHIGDVRQILIPIGNDTSLQTYEVTGLTQRGDGQQLYSWVINGDSTYPLFYYLGSEYFISSLVNKTTDSSAVRVNPYEEQKLAKLFPQPGDTWASFPGNSKSLTFTARYVGDKTTLCGIFHNVYAFKADIIEEYYAPNVGWIGSLLLSDSTFCSAKYLKVNGVEYGVRSAITTTPAKTVNSHFGTLDLFGRALAKQELLTK